MARRPSCDDMYCFRTAGKRNGHEMRRPARFIGCSILISALSGCTATSGAESSLSSRTTGTDVVESVVSMKSLPPRQSQKLSSPSRSTSAVASSVSLSCADGGSGSEPVDAFRVGRLELQTAPPNELNPEVPLAHQLGLAVEPNSRLRFRKTPAYLSKGDGSVKVSVIDPEPGVALAWLPANEWLTSSPPNLAGRLAESVTFEGCTDTGVTYFGGLVAEKSDSCLILRFETAGTPTTVLRQRLNGGRC